MSSVSTVSTESTGADAVEEELKLSLIARRFHLHGVDLQDSRTPNSRSFNRRNTTDFGNSGWVVSGMAMASRMAAQKGDPILVFYAENT